MKKPNFQSYLLLFILAAIWGSAFFNYKIVLRSFDIFTLASGRLFFASIFSVAISVFFLSSVKLKDFYSRDFYWFLLIGLINYAIPFVFIAIGIDKMSSGLAALLMSAGPFYAIILSHFLTDDKFNRFKFIGTCIGFLSVSILVYDQIYITENTNLRMINIEDIGPHYATTLKCWRDRMYENIESINTMGYTDQFIECGTIIYVTAKGHLLSV